MSQSLRSTGPVPNEAPIGAEEAIVSEVPEAGRVIARFTRGERELARARVAVLGYAPREGDRVLLLASPDRSEHFVTGVLVSADPIALRVGTARASEEEGRLVVRDGEGRALLSYHPETGELELAVEEGDLRLAARNGRVRIEGATIESEAREVRTRAEYVGFTAARWELSVGKITERARNVFRDVTGLVQTRAKRASIIAESTLQLFGRRTTVRSKEDTKIDGKRVLLG